ncbi:MAG: protein kinase [Chloroflexi bacterium]|nr:protein kinase [Chloroflexota bacterium]
MTEVLATPPNLTGQNIKGYELQEVIGQGGFGAVYRAFQPAVRREVAVKVILPEYANEPEFIRRFEAEAQLVAHLEHPHIVPLYDYWRDANGAFLVMRWLRGGSLREALRAGAWPLHDVGRLVEQIVFGLAVAHRHGVIHRDLKPDNILLDDDHNAYLADFGIAKDLLDRANLGTLYAAEDEQGRLMGSPYYLSPEQILNQSVSPQSDIYSLGIMLFEILTGKMPYEGLPLSTIITRHLQEPLPHLHEERPDLPAALHLVIARATEKAPVDRYPSVLALYADFRRALLESETTDADLDIRQQTHVFPTELETETVEPVNPYKGLRAFQEADAGDFYGREALTRRLVERLSGDDGAARFLAVVGPSGSGKSSVVKAGLLPLLRQNVLPGSADWFIVEMTPGAHPLEELEAALLRVAVNPPASLMPQLREDERGLARAVKRALPPDTELALVIDQFEETFTQAADEAERSHFLKILETAACDATGRLRVIVTLRADFYDRPLLYPGFGELVRGATEVVLPLNRDELERAIVEPAERAQLQLERGLVPEIVADVGEQPGALPLLQYALTELFERRDGRWLTVRAYRDIGGIAGALAQRADDLYNRLDDAGQQTARQLFLRLVTLNDGAEDTRRRVRQDELLSLEGDAAVMQAVIERFGKYRLLTFDRDPLTRAPTVEVAHEALIRQWPRLRGWLQDARDGLRTQRRLAAAAEEWHKANRDSSFLASGARLDQFEAWSKETDLALAELEADYLRASLDERARQQAAETARRAKEAALERRSRRFLGALAAVLAVATVVAFVLTVFALNQSRTAQENAATATVAQGEALLQADNAATAAAVAAANEASARSLALTSGSQLALSGGNTDLALALALEASRSEQPTPQTMRALAEAAFAPGTRQVFVGHNDRVTSVAYSPDGRTALSGSRDSTAILWNVATGEILHRLEGHSDWVWDVAFSPDGRLALTASADKTLVLWDVESGELVRRLEGHDSVVRSAAFSTDGEQLVSGAEDGALLLWDVETGDVLRTMRSNAPIFDVAFSKSSVTALSAGRDGVITLWNVQAGEPLLTFGADGSGHTNEVWSVAYTPDDSGLLSASEDGTLILWSFESPQPVRRYEGHASRVTSAAFSPDGQTFVSGSEDNSIIVWDVATGRIIRRFIGHTFLVYGVAFSPDGKQVLSGSWDATVRLWDLDNGAEVRRFGGHTGTILSVGFSPDGRYTLSASEDGTLTLWNAASGTEVRRLEGHSGAVNAAVFSPDGRFVLSGSDDLTLILWDVETGKIVRRFGDRSNGHSDSVWAIAFSPDGKLAASGSRDNTLFLWDVATGEPVRRLFGHTFRVTGVAFSPDGTRLISSAFDNLLILWDVATGDEIRRFEGHSDWIRGVAFSPTGRYVLSGSADNTLILWDVETGERLRQYEGHSAQVYSVAFNADGRYVLSGSADGTVVLWDVATGVELRRLTGHTDDIRSVVFSPDERYALSGSGDGTMRLWQVSLSLDDLASWIRANRYVRDLTCAERELYGVPPLCPTPTPIFGPQTI